jgi:alpha-glucosidase
MIIYQIYPRSFKDSNGDGIGDLKGIIDKLEHIASLGSINYIWISPFFKSPMKDFGYDVEDYLEVDPIFGSNSDFQALIDKATSYNIKIMIDLVLAHTSNKHAWFVESSQSKINTKSDWYVWKDPKPDGTPPNNWLSVFGGSAWNWEPRRRQYYLKHFLNEQPALNWHNPDVEEAMFEIVQHWIQKGVKGFRLDAVQFAHCNNRFLNNPVNPESITERPVDTYHYQIHLYNVADPSGLKAIRRLRKLVDQNSDVFLLGEISERNIARRYTGNELLHATYFFDLLGINQLATEELIEIVTTIYDEFSEDEFFWSLSNHDFARHVSRFNPDPSYREQFAKLCAILFLGLPGGYCLYQGEEFGFPTGQLSKEELKDPFDILLWPLGQKRDTGRTPIPWDSTKPFGNFTQGNETWLPVDKTQTSISKDLQEKNSESVFNYYKKAIAHHHKINATKKDYLRVYFVTF